MDKPKVMELWLVSTILHFFLVVVFFFAGAGSRHPGVDIPGRTQEAGGKFSQKHWQIRGIRGIYSKRDLLMIRGISSCKF